MESLLSALKPTGPHRLSLRVRNSAGHLARAPGALPPHSPGSLPSLAGVGPGAGAERPVGRILLPGWHTPPYGAPRQRRVPVCVCVGGGESAPATPPSRTCQGRDAGHRGSIVRGEAKPGARAPGAQRSSGLARAEAKWNQWSSDLRVNLCCEKWLQG